MAKDPKTTQAQLRHADPGVTLKHYQKAIPATVKAAALALEAELGLNYSEQAQRPMRLISRLECGAPGMTRTCDLLVRSHNKMMYPTANTRDRRDFSAYIDTVRPGIEQAIEQAHATALVGAVP